MQKRIEPTWENVRLEHKTGPFPSAVQLKDGKIGMPGLAPCPWCDAKMEYTEDNHNRAICDRDPNHVVVWIPWGG